MASFEPTAASLAPVRRRLVCFLSGFDPLGPKHYHQMFATEAARQAQVAGYTLEIGARERLSPQVVAWAARYQAGPDADESSPAVPPAAQAVHTQIEFLRWDDIVRQRWPRQLPALIAATWFANWNLWRNGVMWLTWRSSWPSLVAAAAPGALLLGLSLALAGLLGTSLAWAATGHGLAALLLLALGLPGLAGLGLWGKRRTHMDWLIRSMACLVRQGRGQTPELEARLDELAAHLAGHLQRGDHDEVLVVGHSSGAMMAMSITARALRQLGVATKAAPSPVMSLLTLGHCTPMLSAQPEALAFRAELQTLVDDARLCWVDYSAPPDGCCYPLIDPSAARQVLGPPAQRPRRYNPKFAELFSPQSYRAVRTDKFRCHFQYLMAGELPGLYDYFAMLCGPQTLLARHLHQPPVERFERFQCFGGPGL